MDRKQKTNIDLARGFESSLGSWIRRLPVNNFLVVLSSVVLLNGALRVSSNAQEIRATLAPLTVTASHAWVDGSTVSALDSDWGESGLEAFALQTVDQLLSEDPTFSLYRRQNALFAAPQTQGVSLRSIGATAAGRSLVLRDGIPQNDPFGGWVPWARYIPRSLQSMNIESGSQAASWGNLSAGGVIAINSATPELELHRVRLTVGSFDTIAADTQHTVTSGNHGFLVNVFAAKSDGSALIHERDRGPIDGTAEFKTRGVDLRHEYWIHDRLRLESALNYYEEERGNGTALTHYDTEAYDVSLRLLGIYSDREWSASVYYQDRSLESVFSSVNEDRTAEVAVLDQFDIPASGFGGNFIYVTNAWQRARLVAGLDVRHLDGETNEDVLIPNRRRIAGGEQTLAGAFVKLANPPEGLTPYELTLRVDHWSLRDGSRVERSNVSGSVSRNDAYRDRSGWEPSLSVSIARALSETMTLNLASGYTFRMPTINELYRPFRVGDDITEANSELQPEQFLNVEATLQWQPYEALRVESGVFHYWIEDAIANVRTTAPSGVFVPAGGSYNQRQNVESAHVLGWQTGIEYAFTDKFSLELNYLYTQAQFKDSSQQPELVGNEFPQIPTHKATLKLEYQYRDDLLLFGSAESVASQYDDPLNRRKLKGYVTGKLGVSFQATKRLRWIARVDNIADATVLTGQRSDGVRSVAPGRSFWLTAEIDW